MRSSHIRPGAPSISVAMPPVGAVQGPSFSGERAPNGHSPWLSDESLLRLAIWWVKETRQDGADFVTEVARAFYSLKRDLR